MLFIIQASRLVDINLDDFNLDNLQEECEEKKRESLLNETTESDVLSPSSAFFEQDTENLCIPKEYENDRNDRAEPDSASLWSVDPSLGTPSESPQKHQPIPSSFLLDYEPPIAEVYPEESIKIQCEKSNLSHRKEVRYGC